MASSNRSEPGTLPRVSRPGNRPSPRRLALRTLREIEQRQGFSNRILSEQLERFPELDRRDRGLVTTLVYGVLRSRGRLDWLIDRAADKPRKIKGELRAVLRIAAFELLELDRPLAIASAEAAKLTKRIDPKGRLRSMIAAILRGVAEQHAALERELTGFDALVHRWSLPRWLAARWTETLGIERALARAEALAQPPALDLRIDLGHADPSEVRARLVSEHPGLRWLELPPAAGEQPQCLRVQGAGDVFHGPLYGAGSISIQSLGSQQAVRVLDPKPGERVLDACAGMGTKTIQIAEHMQRRGQVIAVDPSAARLAELEGVAAPRSGLDPSFEPELALDLQIVEADARDDHPALDGAPFDAILVDAPCTGLGNLARHPELRWTASPDGPRERAQLQASLLERCAARLAPQGRLVYAVCSLEPEEGPAVVDGFLSRPAGAGFRVARRQAWTPEDHRSDGFWLAELVRARALH